MFNLPSAAILQARPVVVLAGAVMDAAGVFARPGALVISEDGRVVFAGPPEGVPEGFRGEGALTFRLPDRLLVPGMVNAHAHLELSFLGNPSGWPYEGSFTGWVGQVMKAKADKAQTWKKRYAYAAAMSRMAGVAAVGDIVEAGKVDTALDLMAEAGLQGVAFAEQFGHDACARERGTPVPLKQGMPYSAGRVSRAPGRKRGLQPHAPYSVGPALFDAACRSGLPLSTHLAETPEEAQFVASATGPFRDLLERLGKWHPDIAANYSQGLSPVRWMEPYLRQAPWLLAHVNYADDADLAILERTSANVAYCPVASDYFLHKNHRYRDMLAAGINVCLGTDSIICQPEGEAQPLGILPQMRHLFRRDKIEAQTLLKMATVNGAKALGLPQRDFTFADGGKPMVVVLPFDAQSAVDPLAQALWRSDACETLDALRKAQMARDALHLFGRENPSA